MGRTRRPGYDGMVQPEESRMTPAELRLTCIELFGKRGWQIGLARFLKKPDGTHVNLRTVRRWTTARNPTLVPFWVDGLLEAARTRRAA